MENLLHLIHGYDIYQNFPYQNYIHRPIGWNVNVNLFTKLIQQTNPKLILELGSWYGASSIAMGKIIKSLKLDTKIVCVDTWLGSKEFIGLHETDHTRQLLPTYGYPNAYYQFLANICYSNLQDIIVPFPQTTTAACKWLSDKNINCDLAYIDGSNDSIDLYYDMLCSWNLLNDNGIMFGDDYSNPAWLSINIGLNKFCAEKGIKPALLPEYPNHWTLQKAAENKNNQLILITCTHNHLNRISYLKYLIKNIISKLNNYTWILVEDGNSIDDTVANLLNQSNINYQYLFYGPTRSGGNAQRNFALEYIVDNNINGIIYSVDDDNLYNIELFNEIRKTKNLSIFPVGGWNRPLDNPERPILDINNKFVKWNSGWPRKYSTDMAGFSFHSDLLKKINRPYWTYILHGGGESEFIDRLVSSVNDIEFNLCDNCTKCYVYHNQLRQIQYPEVDSIPVYISPRQDFNCKYGHSDNTIQTHNVMRQVLSSSFNDTDIDSLLGLVEKVYDNTEGCFGGPDRIEVASIINNIVNIKYKSTILELGCWKGRVSTILNLFKNQEVNVISVDNFLSEDGLNGGLIKYNHIKDTFLSTLAKFNIEKYQLIEENMQNIDWLSYNPNPISYIYYDVSASSDIAISTIKSLIPFMSHNCIIEFHDSSWPTVNKIIEYLCNNYSFLKLYKIDIWEGSLIIQRGDHVVV